MYSTGRGGAGNMRRGTPQADPEEVSGAVPELKQKVYTTGRGGVGNMRDNLDPQITREAQDVDDGLAPISSPTVGRGGYGNVRAGQKASEGLFSKAKKFFHSKD